MPFNPTQAQQSFGTGARPASYMSMALGGSTGTRPVGAVPPRAATAGVDPAWSRIFGSATPAGLLEQRTAAGGVMPPVAAGTNPTSTPTPQTAGAVNGAVPGAWNGNQENGYSSAQQNGGQSNNERGGPPPRRNAAMQAALLPQPPTGAPRMTAGVLPQVAGAGETDSTTREPGAAPVPPPPPSVQTAATVLPAVQPRSAALGGSEATSTGAPYTVGGVGVTEPKPDAWSTWGAARRKQWIDNHTWTAPPATGTPGGTTGDGGTSGDTSGQTPIGDTSGGTADGPVDGAATPVDPVTGQPAHTKDLYQDYQVLRTLTNRLLDKDVPQHYDETASPLGNFSYVAGSADLTGQGPGVFNDLGFNNKNGNFQTWASVKSWDDVNTSYMDPLALMVARPDLMSGKQFYKFGLELDPGIIEKRNPLPEPSAFHATGTTQFSGTEIPTDLYMKGTGNAGVDDLLIQAFTFASSLKTALTDGNTAGARDVSDKLKLTQAALSMYGITYNPTPGDPGAGTPEGEFPGEFTTDLRTPAAGADWIGNIGNQLSPDIQRAFGITKDSDTKDRAAAWEAQMQLNAVKAALENQRRSSLLYGEAADTYRDDPLSKKSTAMAEGLLDNPGLGDQFWQTTRNQYATDQDKLNEGIVQNLSASGARRGLSTGAMAGITTGALSQAANNTARGLGDLSIQRAADDRSSKYQALDQAQRTFATYRGGAAAQKQALGQILMGATPQVSNPAAGVGSSAAALSGLQVSQKQADAADKAANATDWAGILTGVAGIAALFI